MKFGFLLSTLLCPLLATSHLGLFPQGGGGVSLDLQGTDRTTAAGFSCQLRDGSSLTGQLLAFDEKGVTLGLGAGRAKLPFAKLLSFHGTARRLHATSAVEVRLVTGSRVRGKILGGDEGGESLQLQSTVLQSKVLSVQLDFVQLIRLPIKSRLPALELFLGSQDEQQDDVLFQQAALGLDSVKGSLFAVSSEGFLFKPSRSRAKESLYRWKNVVALRLSEDGSMGKDLGKMLVVLMEDGSRFRGRPKELAKGMLRMQTVGLGEVQLPVSRILAGHIEDKEQLSYLSDLVPVEVEELGFMKKLARKQWKYRRDGCCVHGDNKAVRARYWTKGLGVHSYSKLSFLVPPMRSRFLAAVGVDDCAVSGAVRANPPGLVDFSVYVDGKLVAEALAVRGGMAARKLAVIKVKPGQRLTLEVDTGPDKIFTGDRANWLAPVFLR